MIVFKNYFKIVKSFLPMIIIYISIFSFFGILASSTNTTQTTFEETKAKIAIINEDTDSVLVEEMVRYLKKKTKVVTIGTSEKEQKDALFYREVDAILTIPKSYSKSLYENKNTKIKIEKVPNSENGAYIELLVHKFLEPAYTYIKSNIDEQTVAIYVRKDLEKEVKVTLQAKEQSQLRKATGFYNFSNYTILAIVILVVGTIMATYQNPSIKKRNSMGTVSYRKMNFYLFLGNMVLIILLWFLYCILGFILFGKVILTVPGLLLLANLLVFSIAALAIGFCIGNLIINKEAQNGIVNIIALGTSFLCGAFVPQEYLSTSVLAFGKIFPSYYYITNNNILASYHSSDTFQILINMGIMFIYILILLFISNAITRIKRKS